MALALEEVGRFTAYPGLGSDLRKIILDYFFVDTLGEGRFGSVYRAVRRDNQKDGFLSEIAVKVLKKPMENELRLKLHRFKDCNSVQYLPYNPVDKRSLPMEYCAGGNLEAHKVSEGLCWTEIVDYTRQIVNGLMYLHKETDERNGIINMDLKPANILLTERRPTGFYHTVRLGDLDNPVFLRGDRTDAYDAVVGSTRKYWSPEREHRHEQEERAKDDPSFHPFEVVGRRTDIWSLAYVIHDLIVDHEGCCRMSAVGDSCIECVPRNQAKQAAQSTTVCKRLWSFLQSCIQYDPYARPSAAALKATDFLAKEPDLDGLAAGCTDLWSCGDCEKIRKPGWRETLLKSGSDRTPTFGCPIRRNGDHQREATTVVIPDRWEFHKTPWKKLADHDISVTSSNLAQSRKFIEDLANLPCLGGIQHLNLEASAKEVKLNIWKHNLQNLPRLQHLRLDRLSFMDERKPFWSKSES